MQTKKAGKLEDGKAEAQAPAAGCLRGFELTSALCKACSTVKSQTIHRHLSLECMQAKKAGKLEDGMAEAQAQAAGCLRLLSLSDLIKVDVMAAGAVRFLTPLLDSKLSHARWNARQV